MKAKGFTLVEVLIAVMILAIISALTAASISQSIKDKTRIQRNIDEVSSLRSALKVIERDIQMAFHYQDINAELKQKIKDKKKGKGGEEEADATVTGDNSGAEQKINTVFLGEEDELNFTSLNNVRMFSNRPESDQQEVGYYVSDCRKLAQPDKTTKCLWKRSTPYIDEKVDEGGAARVLLEDVKSFQLKYYSVDDDEWVKVWKSNDAGDSRTSDRFPEAVEVTIEVDRVGGRSDKITSVIPIRHPNNKEKKDQTQDNPDAPPPPEDTGNGDGT